jgi:uncharacterized membrane protein YdbT with pleckstrin-like domain
VIDSLLIYFLVVLLLNKNKERQKERKRERYAYYRLLVVFALALAICSFFLNHLYLIISCLQSIQRYRLTVVTMTDSDFVVSEPDISDDE